MQAVATVTYKGQVTIPKQFRKALGVDNRDLVRFRMQNNVIVMEPVKKDLLTLRGSVTPSRKPEDFKAIRQQVRAIMAAETAAETGL